MPQETKYDLEERTANFGKNVIRFCKKIPLDPISRPLISQVVRSSTSIGANYAEVQGGSSKKDFANKIYLCRKEAQETRHWLKMMEEISDLPELRSLQNECQELILIFQKILEKFQSFFVRDLRRIFLR
mgnify:CR=1 FL=1